MSTAGRPAREATTPRSAARCITARRISLDSAARQLAADLRKAVEGEVRFDDGSRALYATDASNYRQVPIGVVVPRTSTTSSPPWRSAASMARRSSRAAAAPASPASAATSRSSSTSPSTSTALDRPGRDDGAAWCRARARSSTTCATQPEQARPDLRPRPVHPRPLHARRHDRQQLLRRAFGASAGTRGRPTTSTALEVLTYDGAAHAGGPRPSDDELARDHRRRRPARRDLPAARRAPATDTPTLDPRSASRKIPRRVSGYNLDELLPENGFNVARALVGHGGHLRRPSSRPRLAPGAEPAAARRSSCSAIQDIFRPATTCRGSSSIGRSGSKAWTT